MPVKLDRRPKVRVRCLGPGKEHTFISHDRARERLCKECQKMLAHVTVAIEHHDYREDA